MGRPQLPEQLRGSLCSLTPYRSYSHNPGSLPVVGATVAPTNGRRRARLWGYALPINPQSHDDVRAEIWSVCGGRSADVRARPNQRHSSPDS